MSARSAHISFFPTFTHISNLSNFDCLVAKHVMFASNYNMFFLTCTHLDATDSIDRFHCHATKNWIGNRPVEEAKKMTCYKRLIYKQFIQVSGLCGPQFLMSYLPKRFTHLCRALYGDAILVHRFVGNSKYQVKGMINFDFGIFFGRKILASIFIECFHSLVSIHANLLEQKKAFT